MVAPYPSSAPPATAPGGDPTAVFGRRIVAFVIDALIIGVPGIALATSRLQSYDAGRSGISGTEFCDRYMEQYSSGACFNLNDTVYFDDGGFDAVSFAPLLFGLLIAVVLQGITGWTPGKLVMGLRTVKEDGRAIGIGRAFVRWILMVVDGQPCGLPLVGLITAGTSTGHRRVGDMAAKSFVVRAGAAGAPIQVPGMATTAAPGYGDTWSQPTPPPGAAWGPSPTASPSSWDQPVAPAPSQWDQGPSPAGSPAAPGGPQWDEARGTYIQWDAAQRRWLQWDEAARRWDVIPGQ